MKALKHLAIVLGAVFLFIGCQKEFSYEGLPDVSAIGTLKNDSGGCMPISVMGNYTADSSLIDSNYVVVRVNFTKTGKYVIETEVANGFSFRDSGYAVNPGLQSIKLQGNGKPLSAQITNFSVTFDTSICSFSVSVAPSQNGPAATYTLAGSPGNCSNANVQGDYEEGVPLTSANTVSIQVNVDSVGTYSINTGLNNGISFTGQGVFSSTGLQTITLQGSGTPTATGTTTIPINEGGTSCSFAVTVTTAAEPAADSAWQFSEGTNFYHGFIDTGLTHVIELPSGDTATALSFYGFSFPGTDSLFQLDVLLPQGSIQTGIYNTDSANADFYLYNIDTTITPPYYQADFTIRPNVNIEINIKSYDPTTKTVVATFSGTAQNSSGQTVTITGGRIYAKVD